MSGYVLNGYETGLDPEMVREVAHLVGMEPDEVARVLSLAEAWRLRQAADETRHGPEWGLR